MSDTMRIYGNRDTNIASQPSRLMLGVVPAVMIVDDDDLVRRTWPPWTGWSYAGASAAAQFTARLRAAKRFLSLEFSVNNMAEKRRANLCSNKGGPYLRAVSSKTPVLTLIKGA
jgi:hypothetical protein